MPNALADPLFYSRKLIALAVLQQALELLALRPIYSPSGIWRWQDVRLDFSFLPPTARMCLDRVLDYPAFVGLLLLQALVSAYVLLVSDPSVFATLFLLFGCIVTAARWRGTVNGGADSMTVLVLTAVSLGSCDTPGGTLYRFSLWYLALQLALSYFVAGVVKLRSADWRAGLALPAFISHPPYEAPNKLQALLRSRFWAVAASWSVIGFELLFPIAFFGEIAALTMLLIAFTFHLANCYAFGLNRFLLAWASAYPVVYYCAGSGLR